MNSRPHRRRISNHRGSTQHLFPTCNVVKSPIGKVYTTRQSKKYQKDRKFERFVEFLKLLMVTAANISELPVPKLVDILIPPQVSKAAIHTRTSSATQKAFQKNSTEQVMAQIYADLHMFSAPNNPEAITVNDRDLKNTLQESWIQSNIKFQTRATFKVIGKLIGSS